MIPQDALLSRNHTNCVPLDESVEAAWDSSGTGVVESDDCGCEAEGCRNITRTLPEHVYHDGVSTPMGRTLPEGLRHLLTFLPMYFSRSASLKRYASMLLGRRVLR